MRHPTIASNLLSALKQFVVAVEQEEDLLSDSGDVWDAYERARLLLGDPVKSYPGGHEDTHFHVFGWQEGDECSTCDDWQEETLT